MLELLGNHQYRPLSVYTFQSGSNDRFMAMSKPLLLTKANPCGYKFIIRCISGKSLSLPLKPPIQYPVFSYNVSLISAFSANNLSASAVTEVMAKGGIRGDVLLDLLSVNAFGATLLPA